MSYMSAVQSSVRAAVMVLATCAGLCGQDHVSESQSIQLELNSKLVDRRIRGGETHTFWFGAAAGQFMQVVVTQRGIDLVVTLLGADGQVLTSVDRPNSTTGPETASAIVPRDGSVFVHIGSLSKTAAPAQYDIVLTDLRPAQPLDGSRILAEQAVTKGEALRARGDGPSLRRAVEQFERAAIEWELLQDKYELAVALYGLGLAQRSLGQSQRAVDTFDRSVRLFRAVNDREGEAIAETGLGWALHHVGEHSLAISEFSHALDLRVELKDTYGEALTLFGLGSAYAFSNDADNAVSYFSRSLELRREIGDRRGEALCLIGMGKLQLQRRELNSARESLERGFAILEQGSTKEGEGDALSHLAWTYKELGMTEKARALLEQSISLAQAAGDLSSEAMSRFRVAELEQESGQPIEALREIRRTLSIVEDLRKQGQYPEFKIAFLANVRMYYEFAIELLESMHQKDTGNGYDVAAFEINELATARNLLDALADTAAQRSNAIPADLVAKREELLRQMHNAVDRMSTQRSPDAATAAKQALDLDGLRMRLYETEQGVREVDLGAQNDRSPEPLRAVEIQRLLDEDSILLEYALGAHHSYLWLVTRTRVISVVLPPRIELESAADRFYDLINARNVFENGETPEARRARITSADDASSEAGAGLSKALLAPISEFIRAKRVLIVREGRLQILPFGALPDPTRPATRAQPFMMDHEIAYLPSASALSAIQRNRDSQRFGKTVGIVADPVLSRSDERVLRVVGKLTTAIPSMEGVDANLPRLYASGWEADTIASLFNGFDVQVKKGFEANRDLMGTVFMNSAILHFASHAIVNHQHPELSAIALTSVNSDGYFRSGFLYAYEIFRLRLPAELVVLSGCQTSLGKDVPGEGMTGLTASFLHAGATGVISTLWPVSDADSADFIVRFYKAFVASGLKSPATALSQVQREMWRSKRGSAAYFWAGYSLEGQ